MGGAYMEEGALLGAYLLYYWPASFLQASRALGRTLSALRPAEPGWAPGRVLDLGSGPGPASAAFARFGAREILALDHSGAALGCAARVLAATSPEAAFRSARWSAGDPLPPGRFDAAVLSHALNEIGAGEASAAARAARRASFCESVLERIDPPGFLLIVEPALLLTSRDLLALRDALFGRGFSAIAPCLWTGPCPALAAGENQTCHDAFPWAASEAAGGIASRAALDRGTLKMSWVAVSAKLREGGAAPRRDEARKAEEVQGSGSGIVVSDAMLNKAGRTRYFLCGAAGRFTLSARLSELGPSCAGFARLGRGDLVSFSGALPREGGGLGLGPGSSLSVEDG